MVQSRKQRRKKKNFRRIRKLFIYAILFVFCFVTFTALLNSLVLYRRRKGVQLRSKMLDSSGFWALDLSPHDASGREGLTGELLAEIEPRAVDGIPAGRRDARAASEPAPLGGYSVSTSFVSRQRYPGVKDVSAASAPVFIRTPDSQSSSFQDDHEPTVPTHSRSESYPDAPQESGAADPAERDDENPSGADSPSSGGEGDDPPPEGEYLRLTRRPAPGKIITPFGWVYSSTLDEWVYHAGVDIVCSAGDSVTAPVNGTVVEVAESRASGVSVVLRTDGGWTLLHSAMSESFCDEGAAVGAGDPLGEVGQPPPGECALPPHLHWEVRNPRGEAIDPRELNSEAAP